MILPAVSYLIMCTGPEMFTLQSKVRPYLIL